MDWLEKPVMFPSGFARLETRPKPIGSATEAKTIGISWLLFCRQRCWRTTRDNHIHFQANEVRSYFRQRIRSALSISGINDDALTVNVSESNDRAARIIVESFDSTMNAGLAAKRLELLKEAFPHLSRVAVLWHAGDQSNATNRMMFKELEDTARALKLQLQAVEARGSDEFDHAFSAMVKYHAEALFCLPSTTFNAGRKRLVELAAKHKLPAIYTQSKHVDRAFPTNIIASPFTSTRY